MNTLYAYVRTYDSGAAANHAPHDSNGMLSLCNCVWTLRQQVAKRWADGERNIWLVALTSKRPDERYLSYICRVSNVITRAEYWEHYPRFPRRWDNYYEPYGNTFKQHPNPHHTMADGDYGQDMKSDAVILSDLYRDFGSNTRQVVPWGWMLDSLKPPRHRGFRRFDVEKIHIGSLMIVR